MSAEETTEGDQLETGGRAEEPRSGEGRSGSRRYEPPRLIAYGRLVDVTLGGTPGAGDSGPGGGIQNLP